jgi:hypothetical protein
MATRSTIAIQLPDGKIKQVYCRWDGYLSYNGKILQEHYDDAKKALALISKGAISSLGKVIGRKHPFSTYELNQDAPDYAKKLKAHANAEENGYTKFYARDRVEKLTVSTYKDFDDYVANAQFEEYNYLYLKNMALWSVAYDNPTDEYSFNMLGKEIQREKERAEA